MKQEPEMAKTRRRRRTNSEVEEIKAAAYSVLAEDRPMTLRQVHYRLVSLGDETAYRNTRSDYNTLSGWLRDMRLDGSVPWEWVEDRLRRPRPVPMWDSPDEVLWVALRAYRRKVWTDQPEYVEVQLEKDALSAIFEDMLRPYGVTLNVGRGYTSWSAIKEAADRYGDGEGVTVLYYGDFDPSGQDMVRSLEENLGELGSFPEIVKCALTSEDIERYALPPDFTKAKDTRRDAFIERHGDVAVELDALPGSVIRERLRDEVEARMDLDALSRTRQLERDEKATMRRRLGL